MGKKEFLSAALVAEVQAAHDLLERVLAPARGRIDARAAMRTEDAALEGEIESLNDTCDVNDEAALQALEQKRARSRILKRRIEQAEAGLEVENERLDEVLEMAQRPLMAAMLAIRDQHGARIASALKPFYLNEGQAIQAARMTPLFTAYATAIQDLRMSSWQARGVPLISIALDGIAAAAAMLAGKDVVLERFEASQVAMAGDYREVRQRQAEAEADAEAENEGRDEANKGGQVLNSEND